MLTQILDFIFSSVPLIGLIIAIALSIIVAFLRGKASSKKANIRMWISYMMLFAVGVPGFWGFLVHVFSPERAATFIGWKPSPFQFEVGIANLGMGLLGVFATRATTGFRAATVLFTTCFLWGAASGHIIQMVSLHNFAAGNAGIIFYTDILIPLILLILTWLNRSHSKHYFV